MKKLILHAGTHKTGTTALQEFASDRPAELRQRGIYYPTSGRPLVDPFSTGHHLLPWSLLGRGLNASFWPAGDNSPERVWGGLRDEIESRPEATILVSSEEFTTLGAEHVRAIATILVGIEVVPIIYFRRFDEYAQALYSTYVLFHRERRAIVDYLEQALPTTTYARLASDWRSVFGESLIIRPYYRQVLTSQSLICDVLNVLGHSIDARQVSAYARRNSGVAWNIVECARVMNTFGASPASVHRLAQLSKRLYKENISYELLAPSRRRQLIDKSLVFFEQEFSSWDDAALWSHLRGSELARSNADWEAVHRRRGSFLSRTVLDALTAQRAAVVRRANGGRAVRA